MTDDAALRETEREILSRRPESSIEPTLDRIATLVNLLGDPQQAYPVIHITGTNGKTSMARMIDALLRQRGLRTGRFTSPHLTSMRERICIDGEPLDPERFVALYQEIQPYIQLTDERHGVPLSFFEVLTGMAFAAFADAPVDVAVVEVGLGGTWDATNVADGTVAVVGPVAIDHTQYLGDTVEEIATEKAGIIKPGALAVLAQQSLPAAEVLLRRVSEVGATVAREGIEFGVLQREIALGGQLLTLRGLNGTYPEVFLPLFGVHQAGNAACALAAAEGFGGAAQDGPSGPEGRRPAGCGAGPAGVRGPAHPGTARGAAPQPHRDRRRGAQPGRHGGHRGRGDRRVQLQQAGRRAGGQRGQGRGGNAGRARAGAVRPGGHAQLGRPLDAGRGARRAGPGRLRGDRVQVAARMDDAIEMAVALADETPDADLPGGGGVLVTGSVITAGDARQLLSPEAGTGDAPGPGPATGRHPFTAADLS